MSKSPQNNNNEFTVTVLKMKPNESFQWPGVSAGDATVSATKIKGLKMKWLPEAHVVQLEVRDKTLFIPVSSISSFDVVK